MKPLKPMWPIVDALDDVDVYERAMGAHDVPQDTQPLHDAEAFLTNTTKHCFHGPGNGRLMRAAIDIAALISGGIDKLRQRPLISFNTCPVSPLKLVKDCCEIIMEGARSGFMVNVLSSDAQAGHEKTLTGLLPALAGTNLIYGLGMLEMGMTFSYSQLVMDCEFAKMIKFVVNGIAVNDETLAVDAIQETGPFKNFLIHPLTMKYMRSQSQPVIMDRNNREKWVDRGSRDLDANASLKAEEILANHQPDPLPDKVLEDIGRIVAETEAELGVGKK